MGLEAKVEAEFMKMLPPWLLPFKLNLQSNTGWPDRMLLLVHPFIAFIEFKAPGRPLHGDRNQDERIAELRARGYPALITDSAAEAYSFLEATALSITGRSLGDLSGLRGASVASRYGKDNLHLRNLQDS
jgi:hypothetical protein